MIEPRNILIVRTDRIGDVVLTLPLAAIIKKHYPDCKVSFLVREYTEPLVRNNDNIDNVLVLKEGKGGILLWENIKAIRKYGFDSTVVVFPVFRLSLIMFLSGIRSRIGIGYRWYSFLFNHKKFEHRKYAERHELEYNVRLLSVFGINETINKSSASFGLRAEKESEEKIEQLLSENKIDLSKPVVIVHPGSGGSAIDLPLNGFKQLVGMMAQELDATIIVAGTVSEKSICNELILNDNVKNLAGRLSLKEYIALINKAEMMIANSTGPIHIAAALKKFVVGFYPRIQACLPERWGPYTEKRLIFSPKIKCSNCTREQCERLNCMESIDIKEVFDNIKIVWKDSKTEK